MNNNPTPPMQAPVMQGFDKNTPQTIIDLAVEQALRRQWEQAEKYQTANGRVFALSWDRFSKLATPFKRKKMGDKMRANNFERFMRSMSGYVITWRTRKDFHNGVLNDETAIFVNREAAKRAVQFGPGDTHNEHSIELIRAARTGTKQKESTRQKIAKSLKGTKPSAETRQRQSQARTGKKDTEETRANKRAAAIARHAAARAAKENNNGAQ